MQPDYSPNRTATAETIKDKMSEAVGAVQEASADAYETVRETAENQPFVLGLVAGAVIGFGLGALWKIGTQPVSLHNYGVERARQYAEPYLRSMRTNLW